MRMVMAGLCAVCVWTSAVLPVSAGWDNVFQPTLFFRRQPATTNYYYTPPVVVQSSPIVVSAVMCTWPINRQFFPITTCGPMMQ